MKEILRFRASLIRVLTILVCSTLLIAPSLLLLWYIKTFAVNIIAGDEWVIVPLLQKEMQGTLMFSDLFMQHNEHRILFPNIINLIIAQFTNYDTIAEIMFSWVFLCLTCFLIFHLYRKKFFWDSYPKLLLTFLPVSVLLFSFRQYDILWSPTIQIYTMIFSAVATFFLLDVSEKWDKWFILGFVSATMASYSFLLGLLVWPTGLLQIFLSKTERTKQKAFLWCVIGSVVYGFYFYGYIKPEYHPPLNYVLMNPLVGVKYFLIFLGAPFSWHPNTATALSLPLMLIALFSITYVYRFRIFKRNAVWLSLIIFAILCALGTTIGRAGFGFDQAITGRYTPFTAIGIIGLYFLALSVSQLPVKRRNFGVHALLTIFLIGLVVTYPGGWLAGHTMKDDYEKGAYILKTYNIQSNENINYLYPNAETVRKGATFLEQNNLNVFADRVLNMSSLIPIHSDSLFGLDTINGDNIPQDAPPLVIHPNQQETITITGWAVDKYSNDVASSVFITINEIDIPTIYGIDRPDIANKYNNTRFRFSGFIATFSSSILIHGEHAISLKIVREDQVHYYYVDCVKYIIVD